MVSVIERCQSSSGGKSGGRFLFRMFGTRVTPVRVGTPGATRILRSVLEACEQVMDLPSFESLMETMREADLSAEEIAVASTSVQLGDKRNIRKTLVRHIVKCVERDFPGRRFSDLAILELGSGAGFLALVYAEVFPHLPPLANLMQTDYFPQDESGVIAQIGISELSQEDSVISKRKFDVVLSVDVLSCLAYGRGLDPDDEGDVDEVRHLDQMLSRMLSSGHGKYYDFLACAP